MFQLVIATYAFGSLLSAIAPNYQFLVAVRILAGLGIGAEFPVAFALLSEFSPTRHRHLFIMAGPFTNAFGYVVTAFLALWLVPSFGWRSMYWFGIIPVILILYLRHFIPESPRYLLARGQVEEAGQVTRQLADRAGFNTVELVPPEQEARELNQKVDKRALYKSVLPVFIALLLVYFFQYIQATGITSFLPVLFVRQGFALARSFQFTLIILCGTTLSHPLAGFLQEWLNRKYAMLLQGFIGGAFFVAAGLSFAGKAPIQVSVALLFFTALFAQGMITVLFTLSSELFPTPIRSVSMGIVSSAARIGSIVGPLLTGYLLTSGAPIQQVIYIFCVPLILASLIALVLIRVDPRQKSLEMITAAQAVA